MDDGPDNSKTLQIDDLWGKIYQATKPILYNQQLESVFGRNSLLPQGTSLEILHDNKRPKGRMIQREHHKNRRKSFAVEQLLALECQYAQCKYLRGQRRCQLAKQLNLTDAQVKIWFQNRRAKDYRCDSRRCTKAVISKVQESKNNSSSNHETQEAIFGQTPSEKSVKIAR